MGNDHDVFMMILYVPSFEYEKIKEINVNMCLYDILCSDQVIELENCFWQGIWELAIVVGVCHWNYGKKPTLRGTHGLIQNRGSRASDKLIFKWVNAYGFRCTKWGMNSQRYQRFWRSLGCRRVFFHNHNNWKGQTYQRPWTKLAKISFIE